MENDATEKGKFRHFMQKEIFEQPTALINTMEGRINHNNVIIESIGNGAKDILKNVGAYRLLLVVLLTILVWLLVIGLNL